MTDVTEALEAAAKAQFLADDMVQFRHAFPWGDQPEPFKNRYRAQSSAAVLAFLRALPGSDTDRAEQQAKLSDIIAAIEKEPEV